MRECCSCCQKPVSELEVFGKYSNNESRDARGSILVGVKRRIGEKLEEVSVCKDCIVLDRKAFAERRALAIYLKEHPPKLEED